MAFIPRMGLMGLTFSQPYLVNASIRYISGGPSLPIQYGYGLIAAYGITYFMQGVRCLPKPLSLFPSPQM